MAVPTQKRKIVKKHPLKFTRFQAHNYQRIGGHKGLRQGIDCPVRRRYKGAIKMPKIGYGSNKKTRHMLPSGFFKFNVTCPQDLELLLMHNGKYAAELANNLSAKTRKAIVA